MSVLLPVLAGYQLYFWDCCPVDLGGNMFLFDSEKPEALFPKTLRFGFGQLPNLTLLESSGIVIFM